MGKVALRRMEPVAPSTALSKKVMVPWGTAAVSPGMRAETGRRPDFMRWRRVARRISGMVKVT